MKGDLGNGKEEMSGSLTDVVERIFQNIDELDEELQGIKFPRGTRDSPARTCRDIYLGHPEFKDG